MYCFGECNKHFKMSMTQCMSCMLCYNLELANTLGIDVQPHWLESIQLGGMETVTGLWEHKNIYPFGGGNY